MGLLPLAAARKVKRRGRITSLDFIMCLYMEASQTRDCCVAKSALRRANACSGQAQEHIARPAQILRSQKQRPQDDNQVRSRFSVAATALGRERKLFYRTRAIAIHATSRSKPGFRGCSTQKGRHESW